MEPSLHGPTPTLASGRYELSGALGEGGMALVCRARDTRLDIDRALKVLLPEFAARRPIRARFVAEARTMAQLDHPNLVRVYDVASEARLPFLVMELVLGGNLSSWVGRNGPMPPRMAVRACIDTARGTAAAHRAGIIHRDIKPHNVLITESGACKLTDFGIARSDQGKTRAGLAMGTPGYMAPEQRTDASSVDVRADVFSIGVTLWTLLNARMVAQLELHVRDHGWEDVPPQLQPVIADCIRYDREGRLGSVGELIERLEASLATLPPDPPGPTLWQGDQSGAPDEAEERPTLSSIAEAWDPVGPDDNGPATLAPQPLAPGQPPVMLPYSMSRPINERRGEGGPLPDWIDRSSLDDHEGGFTVELTDEDRIAAASARQVRQKHEEWERSVDSTAAVLAERDFDPPARGTEARFHAMGGSGLRLAAIPAAAAVLGLLLAVVVYGVQAAASLDLERSFKEVHQEVEREGPVAIQMLVALGGEGSALEQRYLELDRLADTSDRLARMDDLITEMEAQLERVLPEDPSRMSAEEQEALDRVRRMRADLDAYREADDASSTGWFGRWFVD